MQSAPHPGRVDAAGFAFRSSHATLHPGESGDRLHDLHEALAVMVFGVGGRSRARRSRSRSWASSSARRVRSRAPPARRRRARREVAGRQRSAALRARRAPRPAACPPAPDEGPIRADDVWAGRPPRGEQQPGLTPGPGGGLRRAAQELPDAQFQDGRRIRSARRQDGIVRRRHRAGHALVEEHDEPLAGDAVAWALVASGMSTGSAATNSTFRPTIATGQPPAARASASRTEAQ